MKKIILATLLLAGAGFGAFSQKTINDPNAEKRSVTGFHGVAISGSIDLYLTQSDAEQVVVSAADKKWVDRMITEVKDGVLHIYLKNQKNFNIEWGNGGKKLRAYVSAKNIDYIATSGSGHVRLEGTIKADKLKVGISGSGDMEGAVNVNKLSVGLSGSADTKLSGQAKEAEFRISGSGNIGSYELKTDFCEVSISGSGDVYATINKELSASISGSGDVHIKGEGLIRNFRSSGSGQLKRTK